MYFRIMMLPVLCQALPTMIKFATLSNTNRRYSIGLNQITLTVPLPHKCMEDSNRPELDIQINPTVKFVSGSIFSGLG